MVAVFCLCFYLFNIATIFSIIFAALIAFATTYLAFPRLKDAAAADLMHLTKRRPHKEKKNLEAENQAIEDAYVDANLDVLDPEPPASKRA